jgi:hypothetical protein
MNIITNRKVITSNQINDYSNACGCSGFNGYSNACGCSGFDSYSNLDDSKSVTLPSNVSQTNPTGQKKAGMLWDKTKGTWIKATDWLNANPQFKAVLTDLGNQALQNVFGGMFANILTPKKSEDVIVNTPKEEPIQPKTMSNNMKIGIAIVVGAFFVILVAKFTKK